MLYNIPMCSHSERVKDKSRASVLPFALTDKLSIEPPVRARQKKKPEANP